MATTLPRYCVRIALPESDRFMASLQSRSESYRIRFRHNDDTSYCMTVGKISEADAAARLARVEYLLRLVAQGVLPDPGDNVEAFLKRDGKPTLR